MKRKLFLAAWSIAICATALANPIDQTEARQKAQAFMNQKGKTILSTPLHSPRRIGSQQTHAFYVFNTEDNNGFVIVSGDDRTEAILGYADEGNYQEESIPENMKAWLQGYADYIEHPAVCKALGQGGRLYLIDAIG